MRIREFGNLGIQELAFVKSMLSKDGMEEFGDLRIESRFSVTELVIKGVT